MYSKHILYSNNKHIKTSKQFMQTLEVGLKDKASGIPYNKAGNLTDQTVYSTSWLSNWPIFFHVSMFEKWICSLWQTNQTDGLIFPWQQIKANLADKQPITVN